MKVGCYSMLLAGVFFGLSLSGCGKKGGDEEVVVSKGPRSGKEVYADNCAACHGARGEGNGAAATWLHPKPRNFSAGSFKIKSTPSGFLPTDEDLFETVTRGMPGSSMPSFQYLSEVERREVVRYVKELTGYHDDSGGQINHFAEAEKKGQVGVPIVVPTEPPSTVDLLVQGKQLFVKHQCHTCHGENGAGDGVRAATLKDSWDIPLRPRDFNTGLFRGGHLGKDLFLRIATGMPGTPMPAFPNEVMKDDERWALVLYIQSLRRKDAEINDILAPENQVIQAQRIGGSFPKSANDAVWESIDPVRIPLSPLWSISHPVNAVAVKALHNGNQVAILLQWKDSTESGAPIRMQDFQDGVALQFSMKGTTPFLGMGDSSNPVNIWHWKAGWQQEFAGERPDVNTVYASMHSDLYPEKKALYRTAEAAGNLLAQPSHVSPVEDANAKGFGTLTSQLPTGQNVQGRGYWVNGHWNVFFIRDLKSADVNDVKLAIGKSIPLAFAVWDGAQGDRNGRKSVSNWYQLKLEP